MIIYLGILWLIGMWVTVIYNSNNMYITIVNEVENGVKPWTAIVLIAGLYFLDWPVIATVLILRKLKKGRMKIHVQFVVK